MEIKIQIILIGSVFSGRAVMLTNYLVLFGLIRFKSQTLREERRLLSQERQNGKCFIAYEVTMTTSCLINKFNYINVIALDWRN